MNGCERMTVMYRNRERSRERTRVVVKKPSDIPDEWSNGSGLYKQGTAHLPDDRGLLGRTENRGGKVAAWMYKNGKYLYLGEFVTYIRAQQVILGL